MRRISLLICVLVLIAGIASAPRHLVSRTATNPDFAHFESGQVRPIAFTPSHTRLLVCNTPDGRLSVFDLASGTPERVAEIPVGLEPVSVAALSDSEAWVVNQLSDDVSIVNLNTLHTRATLHVGDEPGDVVFAGSPTRAYVSVSEEDVVKVYDPADLSAAPTVIAINGRMPRSLARKADGSKVYVAVFQAGNRTTVLAPGQVPDDSIPIDGQFPKDTTLPPAPKVGLIIQQTAGQWMDMYGNFWNHKAKYVLAETDVVEISTASNAITRTFGDMGSTNFALAVGPTDSRIALANTSARNLLLFEPRLRGYVVETQISFVSNTSGTVTNRKLDPHINYDVLPAPPIEPDSAIGTPTGVAYAGGGNRVYVTSLATDKIAVCNPLGGALSTVIARIHCVAGPTGIVVDDARNQIYVLGRFHNQLQTLSAADFSSLALTGIGFDPTPDPIVNGRKVFYGGFTSGHGDQSCATCHVFGDMDNLVWNLGNPSGQMAALPPGMTDPLLQPFHPMKGPMVTQSLRGTPNTGVLHWRGDRAGLNAFNPAFKSLMGRPDTLVDSTIAAFDEFVAPLVYPPNPHQNLDRTFPDPPTGPSAERGRVFFTTAISDSGKACADCHTEGPGPGTNGQMINRLTLQGAQDIKVPQLRNLYRKTGFSRAEGGVVKRGFGYTHDGSVDNLADFLQTSRFDFGSPGAEADGNRSDMESYLLAFDTGMAPAVGHQITFDGTNNDDPTAVAQLDTLIGQAEASNCDLVAHGRVGVQERGWLYQGGGQWKSDKAAEPTLATADLRALGGLGVELTVTGVPAGSGTRMGLDRDRDTYDDGDELDVGSDPGNALATPLNVGVPTGGPAKNAFQGIGPNPFRASTELRFSLATPGHVDVAVYDVLGREVRRVARGLALSAGPHTLAWDGRRGDGGDANAGVYFVRLRTDAGQWTRAVVRMK